jgi:hypothetical protein
MALPLFFLHQSSKRMNRRQMKVTLSISEQHTSVHHGTRDQVAFLTNALPLPKLIPWCNKLSPMTFLWQMKAALLILEQWI